MPNNTVVLFEKDQTPRIFKNPKDLDSLKRRGRILVNPKFPKGIPPHRWQLENKKIKVLEEGERPRHSKPFPWRKFLLVSYLIIITGFIIYQNKEILNKKTKEIYNKSARYLS